MSYQGGLCKTPVYILSSQAMPPNLHRWTYIGPRSNLQYFHCAAPETGVQARVFSCPQQLNRWNCHSLSHWLTKDFTNWHYRVTLETCDLWDIWSEWWGNMTWPTFWQFLTFLTIFESFEIFWQFWQFFWQFWQFSTLLTIFDNFEHFQQSWQFLTILAILTILKPFDNFG